MASIDTQICNEKCPSPLTSPLWRCSEGWALIRNQSATLSHKHRQVAPSHTNRAMGMISGVFCFCLRRCKSAQVQIPVGFLRKSGSNYSHRIAVLFNGDVILGKTGNALLSSFLRRHPHIILVEFHRIPSRRRIFADDANNDDRRHFIKPGVETNKWRFYEVFKILDKGSMLIVKNKKGFSWRHW